MSKTKSARISPASKTPSKLDRPKTQTLIDPIWREVAAVVEPPPYISALEWCPKHLRIPEETESPGAFDLSLMPHVVDVLKAVNNSDVRRIFLRLAARNSKTFTSVAVLLYKLCTEYLPLLLAGPDKDKTRDTVRDVVWPMLEACPLTRDQLPPQHLRSDFRVVVGRRKIRIGNAGSKSALSGFPAATGVGTEFSKWPRKKSTEAAASKRFSKRFKLFPFDSLQILEGTPGIKDDCEITREVEKASTRRHYRNVPCPHCGEFQRLQFSAEYGKHPTAGIKYETKPDGREDARLAQRTAWYQCVNGCKIEDKHRHAMMNAGVWLAEGLSIDKRGKITGEAVESDDWAFDELSSLYSLLVGGWGDAAAEYVKAREKNDPEDLRSFVNETLARCYDPAPPATKYHEIADRLRSAVPLRAVPSWARFLVWVSDVGSMYTMPLYWWMVVAFGPHARCAPIACDLAKGDEELHQALARFEFSQENSKRLCRPVLGGIDCGYRIKSHSGTAGAITHHLYQLCDALTAANSAMPCVAMHGSSSPKGFPELYRWGYRVQGKRPKEIALDKKMQRGDLLEVNSHLTQTWIDAPVRGLKKSHEPDALTLPAELSDPEKNPECIAFLNQLGAEFYDGGGWESTGPHEWRDDLRYARALAELHVNQQHATWENPPGFKDPVAEVGDAGPDGGSWIQPRGKWDFSRRHR